MSSPDFTDEEAERVIRASNRHGVFLHQAVVREFRKGGGPAFLVRQVSVEHPVSFGKSGSSDLVVVGEFSSDLGNVPVTLAIECKRAYGDRRKLFFLPYEASENELRTQQMRLFRSLPANYHQLPLVKAESVWANFQAGQPTMGDTLLATAGTWVEFHRNNPNDDKAGIAFYDAANQACGASLALLKEDFLNSGYSAPGAEHPMHYLPVIVTNSPLFIARGLDDICLESGNAEPNKITFEEVPMLFYRHPFASLGMDDVRGKREDREEQWRRAQKYQETVLVIKAANLGAFFNDKALSTNIWAAVVNQQPKR